MAAVAWWQRLQQHPWHRRLQRRAPPRVHRRRQLLSPHRHRHQANRRRQDAVRDRRDWHRLTAPKSAQRKSRRPQSLASQPRLLAAVSVPIKTPYRPDTFLFSKGWTASQMLMDAGRWLIQAAQGTVGGTATRFRIRRLSSRVRCGRVRQIRGQRAVAADIIGSRKVVSACGFYRGHLWRSSVQVLRPRNLAPR